MDLDAGLSLVNVNVNVYDLCITWGNSMLGKLACTLHVGQLVKLPVRDTWSPSLLGF